jgi:hypothetical protein
VHQSAAALTSGPKRSVLQVTRGGCLSGAVSALVLPSVQAAKELRGLEHAGVPGAHLPLRPYTVDLNVVLQHC